MRNEQTQLWPGEEPLAVIDDGTSPIEFFYPEPDDGSLLIPFPTWLQEQELIMESKLKGRADDLVALPTPFDLIPPAEKKKIPLNPGNSNANEMMVDYIRKHGNIWGRGNQNYWTEIKNREEVRAKIMYIWKDPHGTGGLINDNSVIFFTRTVLERSPERLEEIIDCYMQNTHGLEK